MSDFKLDWNGEAFKKTVKAACKKAVKESAESIAKSMRKDVSKDSGDLADSINVVPFSKKGFEGAFINAGAKGKEHVAVFVELGTPGTECRNGKSRKPIKAKPFMRTSLKKELPQFPKRLKGKI